MVNKVDHSAWMPGKMGRMICVCLDRMISGEDRHGAGDSSVDRKQCGIVKRNRTIDFLRFILSLMIVPIHADLFIDVSKPLFWGFSVGLVRVGVPFFFIVSGYYLKDRVERGKSITGSMIRYLKLWLLFILLDLAVTGRYYYPGFQVLFPAPRNP